MALKLLVLAATAASTILSPAPAAALGGAMASGDAGLAAHVVMVLGSRGQVCSGTLISQRVIVTAAHCTVGAPQLAVAYIEDGRPVLQAVQSVARNPGFSSKTAVSVDIALLKLSEALPARFRPVSIDGGAAAASIGENLTVAGYGLSVDSDVKSAGTLRSANVALLPKLYPRFMRLGGEANLARFAICKGDSGGPVLSGGSIVGVVYAAERAKGAKTCGSAAQAVRLAPQRGWIDGIMRGW